MSREILLQYVKDTDTAIAELLPLFEPFAQSPKLSPVQSSLLARLSGACLSATDASLLMVEHGRVWEAEIPLRTATEGSLKWLYLLASEPEFATRYLEYSEALPDIGELRSHERAKELLEVWQDREEADLKPFRELVLTDQRVEDLRQRYPRKMRHDLEQAWSFSELINFLSKSSLIEAGLFKSLLHGYWSANQIAHATFEGIMMPAERQMRDDARREAVTLAHSARIASDCYSYCFLRLYAALQFAEADRTVMRSRVQEHEARFVPAKALWNTWRKLEYP